METFTNSDKQRVLDNIAKGTDNSPNKLYEVSDHKDQNIVDECLAPNGLVKVCCKTIGSYSCRLTEKGREFLHNNGFNEMEANEERKRKSEALTEENIRLTNKKLKYELRTRWIAIVSLIISVTSIIVAILSQLHATH